MAASAPSKATAASAGLRLARGVAGAAAALALQIGDPRAAIAEPGSVWSSSSSFAFVVATADALTPLQIAVAEAQASADAKREADSQKLKTLAGSVAEYKKAQKVVISELSLAERQQREVEREVNDPKTDSEKKKLLQGELNLNIRNAIKAKKQDVTRVELAIKRAEADMAATKTSMQTDVQRLKDKIAKLKDDDLKRIKAENLRNAQQAEAVYKEEARVVVATEKKLSQTRERLAALQIAIRDEVASDKKLIQKIESLERDVAAIRKSEQAVVTRVETKTLAAQGVIAQIGEIEAIVKAERTKLSQFGGVLKSTQSLVNRR